MKFELFLSEIHVIFASYKRNPSKIPFAGDLEVLKFLVQTHRHTDSPNVQDNEGVTPIHDAVRTGHLDILKFLVPLSENPNHPDIRGRTPIFKAAMFGYLDIVKFLVPLSENPNSPDNNGETPIEKARSQNHEHVVNFLENYCKKQ